MASQLVGTSEDGIAVFGESQKGEGVRGVSLEGLEGAGVVGKGSPQGSPAGRFDGNVDVNGTVNTTHVSAQGNISALGNVNAGDTVHTTRVELSGTLQIVEPGAGAGVQLVRSVLKCQAEETVTLKHLVAEGNISALGNVNAGNVNAGNMNVTGDIRLENPDCAEEFDVDTTCAQHVAPGTVMVLGDDACLRHSRSAYDKRVAGVISGAGDFKPGIVLDKQHSQLNRKPIALLGKVYCKVDASYAPIEVGDLLTTSDRPGHAMKATDPLKAFGAVIGKALRPLKEGQGLIPILIALQ